MASSHFFEVFWFGIVWFIVQLNLELIFRTN